MRVDHVGTLAGLQQELEGRLAEERESLGVVREPVVGAAVEITLRRARLDEVALAAMRKAEPDRARNRAAVPRYPQLVVDDVQVPDLVLAHAVVPGQDDLDGVATDLEFAAQAEYHVGQAADLGNWCALGCDHHDVHRRRAPGSCARGLTRRR